MPIYSFGAESPLKFELTEEYADSYNRALKAFYEARQEYEETTGKTWVPSNTFRLNCSAQDQKTFEDFRNKLAIAISRHEHLLLLEYFVADHLVKN